MNNTPKMSIEEEITKRLIWRAERLGYTIVRVDTAAAGPAPCFRVSTPRSETGRPPSSARGGYAHGIAGGGVALHVERLRCCATRPS